MMTLEKEKKVNSENLSLSKGIISDKFLGADVPTGDAKSKYPVFDIYQWHLENNLKYERLPYHSKNEKRLNQALALMGNSHLANCTLLDKGVHKRHSTNLYNRVLRGFRKTLIPKETSKVIRTVYNTMGPSKYGSFGDINESVNHQRARSLIRLVTVVHSVESLDVDNALLKAKELKDQINEYVSKMPGAACTGAIEIEITSIKQIRRIRDFYSVKGKEIDFIDEDGVIHFFDSNEQISKKEYRKLAGCEGLSGHLDENEINGESGQFLIHFHGILKVEKPKDIIELNEIFLKNPNWNRVSRQVQFKPFSYTWRDNHKSLEASVKYIARYITKGGSVLIGKTGYLQYNLNFPKEMSMSYEDYLNFSDRDNDRKRQALIEKGKLLDIPILSHHEINSLALVVDGMMNWNKSRTGYVVSVGKW